MNKMMFLIFNILLSCMSKPCKMSTGVNKDTNVVDNVVDRDTDVVDFVSKSDYVKWEGGDFMLYGKRFIPVGFNAYWLGFTEEKDYPTHPQIEEMFIIAKEIGATTIRSHTLGFSSGTENSLRPKDNNLNENAWEPIDYAFTMADKYDIKLVIPLLDGYNYFHGNYGDFSKTRGVAKSEFWTNKLVRSDFKDYIYKWLNHKNIYTDVAIKDSKSLFMIELGNELGNYRPDSMSTTVPTEEWIRDISRYIKSIDKNHFVLNGADESLGKSNEFNISSLDAYSSHFYSKDYSRIDRDSNAAHKVNKPYIIGEYDCNFSEDWFRSIEERKKVKGTLFWNMYPHENGYKNGKIIKHNDGYTLHYPENMSQINIISEHFKRMKERS